MSVAQETIQGFVMDEEGRPLSFATIYVQELKTGTATNEMGRFELNLDKGSYALQVKYLGYTTEVIEVTVPSVENHLQIKLYPEAHNLQEIVIRPSEEDPAYPIMRKAIAKARYYEMFIDGYQSRTYSKRTIHLLSSPKLLKRKMRSEGIEEDSLAFTSESVNLVTYRRPNYFHDEVLSVRSVGDEMNTPSQASIPLIYKENLFDGLSPLGDKAFKNYRYIYRGFLKDQSNTVYKIEVIPRSREGGLVSGFLYIVEGLWAIHSLELSRTVRGFEYNYKQIYQALEDQIWLPLNTHMSMQGILVGFAFAVEEYIYSKEYDITLNPRLPKEISVLDESQATRASTSIDASPWKKAIAVSELKSIISEMKQKEREQRPDSLRDVEFIRIQENTGTVFLRDSIYWDSIRPIPLSEKEFYGYKLMDSLNSDSTLNYDSETTISISASGININTVHNKFSPVHLFKGASYRLGKKCTGSFAGLMKNTHFNTVEGWNLQLKPALRISTKGTKYKIQPHFHYSFARNRFNPWLDFSVVRHSGKLKHRYFLSGGRKTEQLAPSAIPNSINSIYTLFGKRNYLKNYEKTFTHWGYTLSKEKTWKVDAKLEWARRRPLMNNTDLVWFGQKDRSYTLNSPIVAEAGGMVDFEVHNAFTTSLEIEWKPFLRYALYNGERNAISPKDAFTLCLGYRGALDQIFDSDVAYHRLELGVSNTFRTGPLSALYVSGNTGLYLSSEGLTLIDYRHFSANRTLLNLGNFRDHFRLAEYYKYSVSDRYAEFHALQSFDRLALTRIPFVRKQGWKETLIFNGLTTNSIDTYVEIGYGIQGIFRILSLEALASFENGKYGRFGLRLGMEYSLFD